MNLFDTTPLHPSTLSAGTVVYYADAHAKANESLHGLQVAKVMVSTDKSFILDNGKKFNPDNGFEVTRGLPGDLYPYNCTTKAMVKDAEDKLFLVNEVLSTDFSSLTTQQLSMIRDVARGAFTQVTAPSPCGGGCGDTVKVAGIDIEIEHELASQDLLAKHPSPDILIAFTDASYELTEAELDAIDDADEDDEYDEYREDEETNT